MQKRTARLSGLVVLLVAVALVCTYLIRTELIGRRGNVIHGSSLVDEGNGYDLGLVDVRMGDDVYYQAPAFTNKSGREVKLLSVTADVASPGIQQLEARIYQRSDFSSVPIGWATSTSPKGPTESPEAVKSQPLREDLLKAGQSMDEQVILVHVKVETRTRPLTLTGVKVEYLVGDRRQYQIMPVTITLS